MTQKLASADGAFLWGVDHHPVYDQAGGSLQFGNFPPFVPDGAGGAVFTWYTNSPSLQCRVQRVLANGTEAFAHQGVEASTNAAQIRVSPSAALQPDDPRDFCRVARAQTAARASRVFTRRSSTRQGIANGPTTAPNWSRCPATKSPT